MPAPDNISHLDPTASFYQWFNSYNGNTGAIAKLNKMYIYDAKAGDGITLQSSNTTGGFTFAISSVINKGVTFNGPVIFNSSVNFPLGTQISSASKIFMGNFYSGACLGSVVRITSNGGITRAQSDSRTNAEALGIVTAINSSSATVTIVGEISGASLTEKILGSGSFSTGCVYFLSPSTPGTLTLTEPILNGQVSKPILVATSATGGVVLPLRGQYIELVGVSGACGEGLDTIVVPIKSKGETEVNFKLRPGSVMAVSPVSYTDDYESPSSLLKYRKATSQTPISELLGIVSSYVGPYSSVAGSYVYLLVQPIGSLVDFNDLGWSTDVRDAGYIYIDSSGNPTKNISPDYAYSIGTALLGSFLFSPTRIASQSVFSQSGSGKAIKNYLTNGSLLLWQRRGRGDITGITWTSGGTGDYFADRWCVINSFPVGQTFNIVRKNFEKNQIAVKGYPEHYFNFTGITTGANNTFYIENRTEDARTNAGKEMTLSFYAQAPSSQQVVPYLKQYRHISDTPSYVYGSTLTISNTSWTRYYQTMSIPVPTGTTFDTEGYFAVGLRMANSNINIDFAQFMLEEGLTYSTPDMVNLDEEYAKSAYYYQRSYGPKDITGLVTPSNVSGSPPNILRTPHPFTIIALPLPYASFQLKHRMRPSSYFTGITHGTVAQRSSSFKTAIVYSIDGVTNDAFNETAGNNLRNCQGIASSVYSNLALGLGIPFDTVFNPPQSTFTRRSCTNCDQATTNVITVYPNPNSDGSVSSITASVLQGTVLFDQVYFHFVLDLDLYQGLT